MLLLLGASPPQEKESSVPSEKLAHLIAAKRDDGGPWIGADELGYLDGLPARAKMLFDKVVETGLVSEPEHLREILSLRLPAAQIELLLNDKCVVCHSDPTVQDRPEMLFSTDPKAAGSPAHMDLNEFVSDVHFRNGLSCAGCHGGNPDDDEMADEIYDRWPGADERAQDRTWIPDFCARCHADPAYMRGFNPGLATDQYAKYRTSRHGQLLLGKGDSKPAQCVSCHGAHGIRGPESPRSKVHPKQVPETCGACHADAKYMAGYRLPDGRPLPTDQLAKFRKSVHGKALLERGDLGSPACNDCHGNHAALPPEVSSIAQVCRTCHAANAELFEGSKHKEAFDREGWPECTKCHSNHEVAKTDDSMLSEDHSLLCYDCHRENAEDSEKCISTAKYFSESITTLAKDSGSLTALVTSLEKRGLDADPLSEVVQELHDVLKETRSRIHAFDRSEFDDVAKRGRELTERGPQLVQQAEAEYRFRTTGLRVALGVMVLLGILLYLKIRQIESRD